MLVFLMNLNLGGYLTGPQSTGVTQNNQSKINFFHDNKFFIGKKTKGWFLKPRLVQKSLSPSQAFHKMK